MSSFIFCLREQLTAGSGAWHLFREFCPPWHLQTIVQLSDKQNLLFFPPFFSKLTFLSLLLTSSYSLPYTRDVRHHQRNFNSGSRCSPCMWWRSIPPPWNLIGVFMESPVKLLEICVVSHPPSPPVSSNLFPHPATVNNLSTWRLSWWSDLHPSCRSSLEYDKCACLKDGAKKENDPKKRWWGNFSVSRECETIWS